MELAAIFARLQSLVGESVSAFTVEGTRDPYCKVTREKWHDAAKALREDAELKFDFLQNLTAVDWPKKSIIEVVYHLYSYPLRHSFVVKVEVPRDNPSLPSVADIWWSADWNEREQYDLVGVGFTGHPDLRRVMMPDDWIGHPLRKDYKEQAKYRDMPTSRPSPLELLVVYDKATPEQKHAAKNPGAAVEEESAGEAGETEAAE